MQDPDPACLLGRTVRTQREKETVTSGIQNGGRLRFLLPPRHHTLFSLERQILLFLRFPMLCGYAAKNGRDL